MGMPPNTWIYRRVNGALVMVRLPSPSTYPSISMTPLIGRGCPLKYGLVFGAGEKTSEPDTVNPLALACWVERVGEDG